MQTNMLMKPIRLYARLLMLTFCVTFITSCDEMGYNNLGRGKRLLRMEGTNSEIVTFHYENDKLIKVNHTSPSPSFINSFISFEYTGKTVTVERHIEYFLDPSWPDSIESVIMELNNDSCVVSARVPGSTWERTFKYSNGYLTEVKEESHEYKYEFKYDKNNNLFSSTHIKDDKLQYYKYTPSNYPAKGYTLFIPWFNMTLNGFPEETYYAGLIGKDSKNLVSKIDAVSNDNRSYEVNFDYTFYDDGYVKTMTLLQIGPDEYTGYREFKFFYE